jgi:hypothetical protein
MNKYISKFFVLGFALVVSLAVSSVVRANDSCGAVADNAEKPADTSGTAPQPAASTTPVSTEAGK